MRCMYCEYVGASGFVLDHDIPRSRLGPDSPFNLVWACTGCNAQKGAKTGAEYRLWRLLNLTRANFGPTRFGPPPVSPFRLT